MYTMAKFYFAEERREVELQMVSSKYPAIHEEYFKCSKCNKPIKQTDGVWVTRINGLDFARCFNHKEQHSNLAYIQLETRPDFLFSLN